MAASISTSVHSEQQNVTREDDSISSLTYTNTSWARGILKRETMLHIKMPQMELSAAFAVCLGDYCWAILY